MTELDGIVNEANEGKIIIPIDHFLVVAVQISSRTRWLWFWLEAKVVLDEYNIQHVLLNYKLSKCVEDMTFLTWAALPNLV